MLSCSTRWSLPFIHITNIQKQDKWQIHHILQITEEGRSLTLIIILACQSLPFIWSWSFRHMQGECKLSIIWTSRNAWIKVLPHYSEFPTFFFLTLLLFPAHPSLKWKFCVDEKSQIFPLPQQNHWFFLWCANSIEVTNLTLASVDFGLGSYAIGRNKSAPKKEKVYVGTRAITYNTLLQHR